MYQLPRLETLRIEMRRLAPEDFSPNFRSLHRLCGDIAPFKQPLPINPTLRVLSLPFENCNDFSAAMRTVLAACTGLEELDSVILFRFGLTIAEMRRLRPSLRKIRVRFHTQWAVELGYLVESGPVWNRTRKTAAMSPFVQDKRNDAFLAGGRPSWKGEWNADAYFHVRF